MARKITLTVPDMLYDKIDEWRTNFNLSRIFQDAVTDAIRRKEEFQKRLDQEDSIAEIVKRLRQEKVDFEKRALRAAEEAGRRWAAKAPYPDLLTAVHTSEEEVESVPTLREQISATMEQLSTLPSEVSSSLENLRRTVIHGWKQGVTAFWSIVQDRI